MLYTIRYFDEKLSFYGIIGSFLIMIGCVITIVFGTHEQEEIFIDDLIEKADTNFIIYSILDISIIILCCIISMRMHSHHIETNRNRNRNNGATIKNNTNTMTMTHDGNNSRVNSVNSVNSVNNVTSSSSKTSHTKAKSGSVKKREISRVSSVTSGDTPTLSSRCEQDRDSDRDRMERLERMEKLEGGKSKATSPVSVGMITGFGSDENNNININISNDSASGENFKHGIRAVLMCFGAAGVAAWVQIFGKISADLLYDTLNGNNQFDRMLAWNILFVSGLFISTELYMISEMMRIFDAVLSCLSCLFFVFLFLFCFFFLFCLHFDFFLLFLFRYWQYHYTIHFKYYQVFFYQKLILMIFEITLYIKD